jgi:Tfp pilus assembly protein PilN
VPEGVYLRQVKQVGSGVNLQGYSQANARVSTLMRNLADECSFEDDGRICILRFHVLEKETVAS